MRAGLGFGLRVEGHFLSVEGLSTSDQRGHTLTGFESFDLKAKVTESGLDCLFCLCPSFRELCCKWIKSERLVVKDLIGGDVAVQGFLKTEDANRLLRSYLYAV